MVATSAIHDGKRNKEDYTDVCHPGTREEYLRNLKAWASNTPQCTRIEWVNAIAGAGKTAMLRTFCTLLEEQGIPSVSFFIWKGDAKRNTLELFPATVAYQLSRGIPALVPHIEKAITEDPILLQSTFKKQMDNLVIGPLLDACDIIKGKRHLVIVVDGLDELDAKSQTEFLNFIPYFLSQLSSLPISLLVSSRPDPQIVGAFNHPKLASITRATRLGASDADIRKFLYDKFVDINLRYPHLRIEHGGRWPSHEKVEIMVRQSSGLFIWPTVAIGHIDKVDKGLGHNARLEQVLSSTEPKPWVGSPLDNLYRAILEAEAPEDRTSYAFLCFKRRLALLCILNLTSFVWIRGSHVFDMNATPVQILFDETLDTLWSTTGSLSSLFSFRKPLSDGGLPTPAISHRSLRDFTFNRARCGKELYYSNERQLHAEIVRKIVNFFNTPHAYQVRHLTRDPSLSNTFVKSCTEMGAEFIDRTGTFLELHLKEAELSEQRGCCMDDIALEYIPHTWPLVAQVFAIVKLFGGLYRVAEYPVSEIWLLLTLC